MGRMIVEGLGCMTGPPGNSPRIGTPRGNQKAKGGRCGELDEDEGSMAPRQGTAFVIRYTRASQATG